MGDTNRNIVFSNWVHRNFPDVSTILVVADGKGELARKLANKGYQCRVIEPEPRWEGPKHKNVKYQQGFFSESTQWDEDLVVGMHPDEATGEILLSCKSSGKPFAVVPCCCVGKLSEGLGKLSYGSWIKKLTNLFGCRQSQLRISGRNIVLYKKGKKEKNEPHKERRR